MAISAPAQSSQYAASVAKPIAPVLAYDWGAKLRYSTCKLTFTAAGFTSAANGDIQLIRMPAGKVRILSYLSWIVCPIGTATSTFDLGIGAYKNNAGTTVALNGNQLAAALAVGSAALNAVFPLPAVSRLVEIESQAGFDIVCSFATANSPAAGDLIVHVAYSMGN